MRSFSDQPPPNRLGKHLLSAARQDESGLARCEDSTMFSLDRLMADATPSSSAGFAQEEDSGIIDLKALAGSASADAPSAPLATWAGGGDFPLGAPAAEVTPPAVAAATVAPSKRAGGWLIRSLAVVAVVLAAAVVFLLVRGPTRHAGVTSAGLDAGVQRVPTATAVEELSAAGDLRTAATSTAGPRSDAGPGLEAETSARPDATAAVPRPRPNPAAPAPRPAASSAPAPVPKKDDCGCKPDELICHMHCRQQKK